MNLSASTIQTNRQTADGVRRAWLLIELKSLPKHLPRGVYVLPPRYAPKSDTTSSDSIDTWYGVIFVRQKEYEGGIFKFQLQIPSSYPSHPPEVVFETPVFHPQVHPETMKFNLSSCIEWNPNKHQLWNILKRVKNIFYRISVENAVNPIAAQLYQNSVDAFRERAKDCVNRSHLNMYVNNPHSSICFSELPAETEASIRQSSCSSSSSQHPEASADPL